MERDELPGRLDRPDDPLVLVDDARVGLIPDEARRRLIPIGAAGEMQVFEKADGGDS